MVASSVGDPDFRCVSIPSYYNFLLHVVFVADPYILFCAVKRRPKLKSRYTERVEKAIEYVPSIENWDDLVDPRTLTFYSLGPDPSTYILHLLRIEEKKSKY